MMVVAEVTVFYPGGPQQSAILGTELLIGHLSNTGRDYNLKSMVCAQERKEFEDMCQFGEIRTKNPNILVMPSSNIWNGISFL